MTTEEQLQASTIQDIDGADDHDTHEQDDETTVTTSDGSGPPARRSRFFRSKRKQRLQDDQTHEVQNNSDTSNDPVPTSESFQQAATEPSAEQISTTDTDTPTEAPSKKRSTSPPPPPTTDDNDEQDTSSASDECYVPLSNQDTDADQQTYRKRTNTTAAIEKKLPAPARPSLPTIYSGYQRKKSQSVKLTRIDTNDPNPKKNVRFADDFGLDLSQVKMIKSDELPHVPSAAFKDLHISADDATSMYQERMKTITYLEQQFENPMHAHGFEDRVSRHKIVLEQANAIDNRIYGTIKIVSLGMNKRVKIRYSTDNWLSYRDYDATYIMDSFDGTHDRFTFTLEIERDRICIGNNIQFCICYESFIGPDFWDSNYQENYRFNCISRTIPDYSG